MGFALFRANTKLPVVCYSLTSFKAFYRGFLFFSWVYSLVCNPGSLRLLDNSVEVVRYKRCLLNKFNGSASGNLEISWDRRIGYVNSCAAYRKSVFV